MVYITGSHHRQTYTIAQEGILTLTKPLKRKQLAHVEAQNAPRTGGLPLWSSNEASSEDATLGARNIRIVQFWASEPECRILLFGGALVKTPYIQLSKPQ